MLVCNECFHFLDIEHFWRSVSPKQHGECDGCNKEKECYYLIHKVGWKSSAKKSVL